MVTSADEGRREMTPGMGTQRTSTIIVMYYFYVWMMKTEVHCFLFCFGGASLVVFFTCLYISSTYFITYVETPPKKGQKKVNLTFSHHPSHQRHRNILGICNLLFSHNNLTYARSKSV